MNITRKTPQKSRVSPKNPYDTTGYHDNSIAIPIEDGISKIKVNFGNLSQNDANFTARVCLLPAQKSNTHQKTTAIKTRRGFVLSN
jgi:hypothetical protein